MISKKYLDDYRVEKTIDENGRVRSEAVYIGGDFYITPQVTKGNKLLVFGLSILLWIAFVAAMLPVSYTGAVSYIMLPFICNMLPLYFMTNAAFWLLRVKETMRREQADKIEKRLKPGAFFTFVLSGVVFLGIAITAVFSFGSYVWGDIIFAALCLVMCAASAVVFFKCRNIKALREV